MRIFWFLSALLWMGISQAQNLLPNPQFSDVNICCEYHVSCAPMGWWTCSGGTFNFQKNEFDKNGKLIYKPAMMRILSHKLPDHRSYIQAPILCPLTPGASYTLAMTVRGRNYLPKELGIWLSDTFVNQESVTVYTVDSVGGLFRGYRIDSCLRASPDTNLELEPGNRLFAQKIKLHYRFQATGKERFLILGNFKNDASTSLYHYPFSGKADDCLLEVYEVSLLSDEGIACETEAQLEILDRLNRRHTFYGACSDTVAIDMNRLFAHIWPQPKEETPNTLEYWGKKQVLQGIHFAFDDTLMTGNSLMVCDSLIELIKRSGADSLILIGHTDSLGGAAYNDSLSLLRARTIAHYVQQSIAQINIRAVGKGSTESRADNGSEEGRALNRRVEFILLKSEDGTP
ncbi:MAG: OmpA family protein [Bacteroidetes bacterium]|nr:MAG: OmpA family protein [Bacteroidota bacterium]